MYPKPLVVRSFLYVEDNRPVLVFDTTQHAEAFKNAFQGAEIYDHKEHVFLPTPKGLVLVYGANSGETAYMFHTSQQAKDWLTRLQGCGEISPTGLHHTRTVLVGKGGPEHATEPVWPGVA